MHQKKIFSLPNIMTLLGITLSLYSIFIIATYNYSSSLIQALSIIGTVAFIDMWDGKMHCKAY